MRHITALVFGAITAAAPLKAVAQSARDLDLKERIEAISTNPTAAQEDRKLRSMARLEIEGVAVTENLPVIESEAQALRRTDREVAERAIGLMMIAVLGETGDRDLVANIIRQFGARKFLTPAERRLLDQSLSEQQRLDAAWRYEGVEVLLWSIGLIETLSPADQIADVPAMAALMRELGTEGIMAKAKLRPQAEILDATDYIYRLHWAFVDARLNGTAEPEIADAGVVFERHYALNWLIGHLGLGWDDMSTDT